MGKLDLIIGPLYFIFILVGAWMIRPFVCNRQQQVYFLPALGLKMVAAIALGFLYQFYYNGGDTFTYFTHGATHIWEAFLDSPLKALRLIFLDNNYKGGIYEYAKQIWVYRDSSSYVVVRFAGFFSIFSFGTYSATALFFALFSFSGMWAMYSAFYKVVSHESKLLVFSILFIPSVIFWGSGILKDTLTIGAIGWATWGVVNGFILKRKSLIAVAILLVSLLIIFSIKKYVVLCFIPSVLIWLYIMYMLKVKSPVLKVLIAPVVLIITLLAGYLALDQISKEDPRYALDRIGETAMITAMDIGYWTGKDAGSKYSLGIPDPSLSGILSKAPTAVNVALFRPYLWEIRNPFMLVAGLESFMFLILTVYVLWEMGWRGIKRGLKDPTVVFCLVFALIFAFAVGISTYNFGSLARYKIPLLPYYLLALILLFYNTRNYFQRNLNLRNG